jgi:hypothetical protein
MPQGRSGTIEVFPLTEDSTVTPIIREVRGAFRVFVSKLPDGAQGVRLLIDGTDYGEVQRGDYFDNCEGKDVIRTIAISAPAQSGEAEILLANQDCLPFPGGEGGGTGDLRRIVESWWGPHLSVGAGAAMSVQPEDSLPSSVRFWGAVASAAGGANPVLSIRTIRCAVCRPNGGTSDGRLYYSPSWIRKYNEVGGVTAPLLSRLHPRYHSYNVEFLMRCEGDGNSHGGGGQGTGLFLMQGDGGPARLSGNIAGFGIVRDGAVGGWWRFVSRFADAGALLIDDPLPSIGVVTDWCKFRVELIDADPVTRTQGKVNIYQNDIPVLSYRDADMDNFPPPNGIATTRTGFDVNIGAECANVDTLNFARGHYWIDSQDGGTS